MNIENWMWNNFGKVLLAFIVCILVLYWFVYRAEKKEFDRLIQQCLEDGRKEYECQAMLKRNSSDTSYVPVIIPIHTR